MFKTLFQPIVSISNIWNTLLSSFSTKSSKSNVYFYTCATSLFRLAASQVLSIATCGSWLLGCCFGQSSFRWFLSFRFGLGGVPTGDLCSLVWVAGSVGCHTATILRLLCFSSQLDSLFSGLQVFSFPFGGLVRSRLVQGTKACCWLVCLLGHSGPIWLLAS